MRADTEATRAKASAQYRAIAARNCVLLNKKRRNADVSSGGNKSARKHESILRRPEKYIYTPVLRGTFDRSNLIQILDFDWVPSAACAKEPFEIEVFDPDRAQSRSKVPRVLCALSDLFFEKRQQGRYFVEMPFRC